ncbi:MAG: tetratricopeptide repeat protein [Bacteroidales bacterium]|nr:tetratricopeptide repeat protein [Bacteroidales bacterium]
MNKLITIVLILTTLSSFSQKENRYIREGNRSFEKGDFSNAEKDYRKALEVNNESAKGQFNLGTAVYKEKNFEESANIFAGLSEKNSGKTEKAEVFHNLGNSLLEGEQYEKSIEAYKQALLNNPGDVDSKYNLEYARMKLKQQQQQQQQNKDNKDQKDQEKQDQEKQDQQQNQDQQDQQKQPPKPNKISKEDADRMLEAMKKDEKKTMEKVKKQKAKAVVVGIEKDW